MQKAVQIDQEVTLKTDAIFDEGKLIKGRGPDVRRPRCI